MARPGPALFELIRGGSAPSVPARSAPSPGKPLVKVTPKAPPAPAEAEPPVPPAAVPAGKPADKAWAAWSGKGSWGWLKEPLTVRMSTVLIAIGVAVAVLVITWGVAYTFGKGNGVKDATRDLGSGVKPETIPLNSNLVTGPTQAPEPKAAAPVVERKQTPPAFTAGADPRVAGYNYKVVASGLDKAEAERMVTFLNQNGLPAGTAVDKPASGSNNRGSSIVFAAKGVSPEEYKNRAAVRDEVDAAVARAGKLWQKDKKGQTDFSQAFWQKFKG